jgi:phosphatidylethanolamine/phosphatidyl-N-methylethanolamine N-methyltransferase
MSDAFGLLQPSAPFIQFTYAVVSPIPRKLPGVRAQSTERIWLNLPPAQVWVYRKG